MPLDIAVLVEPAHTVLVTQECQIGVIGETSPLALKDVAAPIIPAIAALANAARDAGIPVVHCVAWRRADGLGSNENARLFKAMPKSGLDISPGSKGAEVLPEIGPAGGDIVLGRYHGLGPMGGTDLDAVCRNLGATTIIGVGVSVNIGMLNFAMDAVNAGYQFVMPRDCVAGVPADYADAVIDNTIGLIATVVSSTDITGAW
ncbi:MAG: isochorismatase family protein [Actinobacteria bacterium]|nr:isochorismatase family protein [Actinomycetota bacterium]